MRYFLLIIVILGFSCQPKPENLEIEVIRSTLLDVIDTLHYNQPPPLPPQRAFLPDSSRLLIEPSILFFIDDEFVISDSLSRIDSLKRSVEEQRWFDSTTMAFRIFDWEQYRIDSIAWVKSLNEPRPTHPIILKVFDSLISNKNGRIKEISDLSFEGEYGELIKRLHDTTAQFLPLDFNRWSSSGKYQIEPSNYQQSKNERVVATLTLSRVVFNSDNTMAAYYYQEYCGILCGYGFLVFAERTANGWQFAKKKMVWIS